MRIKEVEDIVGISRKNIRFYEKEGLLSPGRELENSYRDYTEDDIRKLRIIKLLRKLDMPLSSIRDVLELRIGLRESVHLQELMLEEQRIGIANAQRVCRLICEEGADLANLDTEHYLSEILHAEENSTELVNIRIKDTGHKYLESVVATAVILLLLLGLVALFMYLYNQEFVPKGILLYFIIVIVLVFFGVVIAMISRIKEIKRGEEDNLSQY